MIANQYPKWWQASPETLAIWQAEDTEAAALRAHWRDILDQCNVGTATWGLALWERQLDLPTDSGLPDDLRRSKILAKLRGVGTVTLAMMQAVAESYTDGEVVVEEYPKQYYFNLRYLDTVGVAHQDQLMQTIEEIKPAHLEYHIIHQVTTTSTIYTGIAARQGDRYRLAPVVCSGYRQNPVYCGIAPRQGDRYQLRPLNCGPLRRDPVRVGMVMRQADKIIVKQVTES